MRRDHVLSCHERHLLQVAHENLAAITLTHSAGCQCDLCSARVLANPPPDGVIQNSVHEAGAAQRILDRIDIGNAMLS